MLELASATIPESLLPETVTPASDTWAPFWATMPLLPPVTVTPERVTRWAPVMVTASLPLPLMAAAPTAFSCRPLALMAMGPVQVPLMLITVLGKALAARAARASLWAQLMLTVGLNCAASGAARHKSDTAECKNSRVRWSMDCHLVREVEGARQRAQRWMQMARRPGWI